MLNSIHRTALPKVRIRLQPSVSRPADRHHHRPPETSAQLRHIVTPSSQGKDHFRRKADVKGGLLGEELVVQASSVHRPFDLLAEPQVTKGGGRDGGDNPRASAGSHHQANSRGIGEDGRGAGGKGAFLGVDSVCLGVGDAEAIRSAAVKVVHLIVQQDARRGGEDLAAKTGKQKKIDKFFFDKQKIYKFLIFLLVIDGRGDGDGVALAVDDRYVGGTKIDLVVLFLYI